MAELIKDRFPEGLFCQSCGLPLESDIDSGTNADGTKNKHYCQYCYKAGKFLEPNMTMEGMIEKVVSLMKTMMPEAQAREIASTYMPELSRWKKK